MKLSADRTVLISVTNDDLDEHGCFVVPDSVTEIGDKAFVECQNIQSFKSSPGLRKIGRSAFWRCEKLTEVSLSESIEEIGEAAFHACSSLKRFQIPSKVRIIQPHTFKGCEALEELILHDDIEEFGHHAFVYCKNLKDMHCPTQLKKIGAYAFHLCITLEKMVISERVDAIGDGAFYECFKLQSIEFLGNRKKIGKEAFSGYRESPLPVYLKQCPESIGVHDHAFKKTPITFIMDDTKPEEQTKLRRMIANLDPRYLYCDPLNPLMRVLSESEWRNENSKAPNSVVGSESSSSSSSNHASLATPNSDTRSPLNSNEVAQAMQRLEETILEKRGIVEKIARDFTVCASEDHALASVTKSGSSSSSKSTYTFSESETFQALYEKKAELERNGHSNAAGALGTLITQISDFEKNTPNPFVCKLQVETAILNARRVLEAHRGLKGILNSLIHRLFPSQGLYFFRTDSAKKLDALEEAIKNSPFPS